MTTTPEKEDLDKQKYDGPLSKIGDVVEDIFEDILDKVDGKPDHKPDHKGDEPTTEPDPCCGPPTHT